MTGWIVLFSLLTTISALYAELRPEMAYWSARFAAWVFGFVLFLSVLCSFAGKVIRNSLR